MADYPPLSRFYVASYAANDRDYPVVAIRLDPRTAGYRVPEDLSPHPDGKRYPNHIFTGAQPASGDQIVTHVYEILPAPWVPFTRYDDDLGPIQGRRRSVKNEGQVASLGPDQRVTYEAREGSAIVYTEIEESWSIKTDDDGNSLFPKKVRDIYDEQRGSVEEVRQLVVSTGDEVGSLEYNKPILTEIAYEPYNEYLLVKITRTFDLSKCPISTNDVYDNSRGSIQQQRQFIVATGSEEGSISTSGDTITQISYEAVNEFIVQKTTETWKVSGPERLGKQTGQWGIEETEAQNVDNSTDVDYGFGVKSGAIVPISKEQSERRTERFPEDSDGDGIIYTLNAQEQDETTNAVISIEKSLVDASRADLIAASKRSGGFYVEVQPLDKWHSITIASKITGAPNNESWVETGNINLPNKLLEVGIIWDSNFTQSAGTAGLNNISEIIANEISWSTQAECSITGKVVGVFYTKVKNGYSGAAQLSVQRTFHPFAPTNAISIHKFEPVYGTVTVISQSATNSSVGTSSGVGDINTNSSGANRFNNDYGLSINQFGPVEHTNPALIQKGDPRTITQSVTASSGSTPSGPYPVATAAISLTGVANLELPTSSTPLNSGQTYVFNVDVKPWRLGWWVREVYTATVP
jgi:hypothetical protein